ncbi:lamin tail domain-containing protein [Streptomyces bambusae]|uniref:lamin tail domain-containing protein n=1 Tax=Streptomyces bambusae TaxID=1550616 RepID=UPI001CFE9783|nr:lamin tail domain-containing protein [Streptomyces bambusae]MCB5167468.1 lamin tail domain-containing protein [Streptomyces bambusae]
MRIIRSTAVAATTAALLGGLGSAPASAAGGRHVHSVHFGAFSFNSPGKDTRSAKSRNGEWIDVHNHTSRSVNLKGWRVATWTQGEYVFGRYVLRPGKTVRLHTGPGRNTGSNGTKLGHVYWNSAGHRWNNTNALAFLHRPDDASFQKTCRTGPYWGEPKSPGNCHETTVA